MARTNTQSMSERRKHERYVMPHMYTAVSVRPMDSDHFLWDGHAYDLSEGGVQFELDRPIEPGTPIAMRIDIPGAGLLPRQLEGADRLPVYVLGNVVWLEDADEPGPVRMAAVFSHFARSGDRERLLERLVSGYFATRAA